jgi:hypothetical protein
MSRMYIMLDRLCFYSIDIISNPIHNHNHCYIDYYVEQTITLIITDKTYRHRRHPSTVRG